MMDDPNGMAAKNNLVVLFFLSLDSMFYNMFGIAYDDLLRIAIFFMDEETLKVAATVAGEASAYSSREQRAIANVIVNRYYDPYNYFSNSSLLAVISEPGQFGYEKNSEYFNALNNYKNGGFDYKGAFMSCLRQTAYVLYGLAGDNTGGAVFFNYTRNGNDANPYPAKLERITGLSTSWHHNNFYRWKAGAW